MHEAPELCELVSSEDEVSAHDVHDEADVVVDVAADDEMVEHIERTSKSSFPPVFLGHAATESSGAPEGTGTGGIITIRVQ